MRTQQAQLTDCTCGHRGIQTLGGECVACESILNRIIDARGCSRDVARIRAGIGITSDGHSAKVVRS
jgi:hypothetical protein